MSKNLTVQKSKNLRTMNSFGFDVRALYFAAPRTSEEAKMAASEAKELNCPVLALGGGSNVLFTRDYQGLVLHPCIDGIVVMDEDEECCRIAVGAGVVWDNLVAYTVERGLGGLENLSLIPGSTGAAPVQNIGAYGAEAKDAVDSVEGFYLDDLSDFTLDKESCRFAYRDSIFKRELKGKILITRVVFRLSKRPAYSLSYGNLDEEIRKYGEPNLDRIRRAVIEIRRRKLPDPAELGNAGSFFKNPTVDAVKANELRAMYPDMPIFPSAEGRMKLAAGKLIEICGFKGARHGNVGVHEHQALVLVNRGGGTPAELLELSDKIRKAVHDKFGVDIEPEVNVI
ncbi:MAG: UDP-N-acetylmuramate dehydrogenase [Prevotellaceae bacterium]|nr:UDP-N-acetylmuramate dehydrogenase [Prevotellaceae bacterium]